MASSSISQRAKEFIKAKERDLANFRKFLESRFELQDNEDIEAGKWDEYLAEYFMDARKANGEEYEPDTLQMRKSSINRYLKSKGSESNLSDERVFELSNQTLAT